MGISWVVQKARPWTSNNLSKGNPTDGHGEILLAFPSDY